MVSFASHKQRSQTVSLLSFVDKHTGQSKRLSFQFSLVEWTVFQVLSHRRCVADAPVINFTKQSTELPDLRKCDREI